jgi:hypothetical protein
LGCWDPQSWVWTGTRAERVSLAVSVAGPCEIGSDACGREPESVPPELVIVTAYEVAALTCALKQAQHEHRPGADPFDAKSCFEAEMTLWSSDDADPAHQPFEGLSCTEQDPQCRSVPPPPPSVQFHSAPTATVPAFAAEPARARSLPSRPAALGAFRRGVRDRVDRPPAA